MITVGIIAEYNPFHNGHKRQIERIRAQFDEEVTVVALMSGNFVQRGEFAVLPKGYRAMAASACGVDLVLEYPYPFSGATAEKFALGGVAILSSLGVDYLAFGSESGEIAQLLTEADRLSSEEFEGALSKALAASPAVSYAVTREQVYAMLYEGEISKKANDILGVAYLMAIKRLGSRMKPLVIKREGFESATASRRAYRCGDEAALLSLVPKESFDILKAHKAVSAVRLEKEILFYLRLSRFEDFDEISELTDDLCHSILSAAGKAETLDELYRLLASKTYTNARIRRALLAMLLRLSGERLAKTPSFTRLLSANAKGRRFLDGVSFPVLTRAADLAHLDKEVREEVAFAEFADRIFAMADENEKLNKPYIL